MGGRWGDLGGPFIQTREKMAVQVSGVRVVPLPPSPPKSPHQGWRFHARSEMERALAYLENPRKILTPLRARLGACCRARLPGWRNCVRRQSLTLLAESACWV
jgi:hypothetical protein